MTDILILVLILLIGLCHASEVHHLDARTMSPEQKQEMLALYRNKTRFRHYVCKNPDMDYCLYKDWNAQFCFDNFPPFCTYLKLSGNCKHAAVKQFARECRISCDADLPDDKKCKPYMIKDDEIYTPKCEDVPYTKLHRYDLFDEFGLELLTCEEFKARGDCQTSPGLMTFLCANTCFKCNFDLKIVDESILTSTASSPMSTASRLDGFRNLQHLYTTSVNVTTTEIIPVACSDKLVDFCRVVKARDECSDGDDDWVVEHCANSCTKCTGNICTMSKCTVK